jgi:hypothetical protein
MLLNDDCSLVTENPQLITANRLPMPNPFNPQSQIPNPKSAIPYSFLFVFFRETNTTLQSTQVCSDRM